MRTRNLSLGAFTVAVGLVLSLSPALAAGQNQTKDAMRLARGAKAWADNCGRCHNLRSPKEFSDRSWSLIVMHMRVRANLPGKDAKDIEAFLKAANSRPLPGAPAGQPTTRSGKKLIQQYGCGACHVVNGRGGNIGPNLDTVFQRRSEAWIRVQIKNPHKHNPASLMPVFGLTDQEVNAIIQTLRRYQKPKRAESR